MAENKTKPTAVDVDAFLEAVEPHARREEARAVRVMMERVTGEPAVMWGPSIVGFGRYHYRYESGREGDACRTGFSPRKAAFTFYITTGFDMREDILARLGKHSHGKGCLYVKRLADVDPAVLEEVIAEAYAEMRRRYPD